MSEYLRCGCCSTGAEYIRRHVDRVSPVPLGVDPTILAVAALELLEDGYAPVYVPDVRTLAGWIREAQGAQQNACCGAV